MVSGVVSRNPPDIELPIIETTWSTSATPSKKLVSA